jgi:hypothetical protein
MYTLGSHFEKLQENIRPPQHRLDAARDLPPLVRNYLRKHPVFATVSPHTRLVGSYAQHLSVGDVKDVDFLVRVDGDPEANDPEAKRLIGDLNAALDGLPKALGYQGYTTIDIERARRSVHVYLEGQDFHMDVVPCIAPDGFDEAIWVPDRGFNVWVPSHPVGVLRMIEELDDAHGGKVRPLIRLLKAFRNFQMKTRQPKSYWLLALAIHRLQEGKIDTDEPLAVVFLDLIDAIHSKYASLLARTDGATPNILDPMLGHNVSWNWQRSHFETFMRRLDDGRRWATNALEADDREQAIRWWQRLFGSKDFPTDVSDYAKNLAIAGRPGTAVATGAGLILPAAGAGGIGTPIRQTTFHGAPNE